MENQEVAEKHEKLREDFEIFLDERETKIRDVLFHFPDQYEQEIHEFAREEGMTDAKVAKMLYYFQRREYSSKEYEFDFRRLILRRCRKTDLLQNLAEATDEQIVHMGDYVAKKLEDLPPEVARYNAKRLMRILINLVKAKGLRGGCQNFITEASPKGFPSCNAADYQRLQEVAKRIMESIE